MFGTGEVLEDRDVLVGRNNQHIYAPIQWKQKNQKTGMTRTTLFFDPEYKTPDDRMIDGQWYRNRRGSQNPGIDPES